MPRATVKRADTTKPQRRPPRRQAKKPVVRKDVRITEDEADAIISERRMRRAGRMIPLEEATRRLGYDLGR